MIKPEEDSVFGFNDFDHVRDFAGIIVIEDDLVWLRFNVVDEPRLHGVGSDLTVLPFGLSGNIHTAPIKLYNIRGVVQVG